MSTKTTTDNKATMKDYRAKLAARTPEQVAASRARINAFLDGMESKFTAAMQSDMTRIQNRASGFRK